MHPGCWARAEHGKQHNAAFSHHQRRILATADLKAAGQGDKSRDRCLAGFRLCGPQIQHCQKNRQTFLLKLFLTVACDYSGTIKRVMPRPVPGRLSFGPFEGEIRHGGCLASRRANCVGALNVSGVCE